MTHTKANKSKILALILGLTMCLALMLGIVFASPTNTARAEETDPRIPVSTITATSNVDEVVGYGKNVATPSFEITEGSPAYFLAFGSNNWQKKTAADWERYTEATFTEGTYMYSDQIRVDGKNGTTHVLNKDGVSVYIDGDLRADNQKPDGVYDTYSLIYVDTIDYEVVKAVNDELVPVTDLEKTYNETAQEPTFGGTLVRGTDYEVSYAVKAGSTGRLDFSGKPVDAGTYIVTVTGKGAYEGSFTKEFVINKAAQTVVPEGLIANSISCRDGSGTIDGVTIAMEYRKVGDADYTKCTPSKITGLAAGEYLIRYAENENYLASADVTVTIAISHNFGALIEETPATCIADGMKAHYYCSDCRKYFDESKNETTETALTIPATGVHTFGTLIDENPATCIAGGMKAHYKCTVCGKYFDADKNETTEEALKTPISPYYGHDFGRWVEEQYATCQAPGRKGYKHCSICNKDYDASNTVITDFVIPVNPDGHELGDLVAEVPATCKDTGVKAHRDCNLCGKHCDPITRKEIADLTIPTTNSHTYGELIPEVPATTEDFGVKEHKDCTVCGRHFDKDGNEITELRIAKIGTHNVVINGESKFYAHGDSVTVTAEDKDGKEFKGWKDESGKIVSTNKSYTFTVKGETTLTAVYQDKASGGGTIDGEIAPAPDKNGLSGGQIAGIVIGSIAGVGIVGFAIFWFVVKKKTFAELISAIKALFNKKQ
ncbi:MAG: InlB B-repeat-containing protein [Oscillospiraceae bacterium]